MMIVDPQGSVRCLYSEAVDLTSLGSLSIRRASHVEPDEQGHWWADLAPMQGPKLGPFQTRSGALDAERSWLETFLTATFQQTFHDDCSRRFPCRKDSHMTQAQLIRAVESIILIAQKPYQEEHHALDTQFP